MGFGSSASDEKSYEAMRENIMDEVKRIFRPEFLNRVDEIIVFHALEQEEIDRIAALMLSNVQKRLRERDIDLEVDDSASSCSAPPGTTCNTARARCAAPSSAWSRTRSAKRYSTARSSSATASPCPRRTASSSLRRCLERRALKRPARLPEQRLNPIGFRGRRLCRPGLSISSMCPNIPPGRITRPQALRPRHRFALFVEQRVAGDDAVFVLPRPVGLLVRILQYRSGLPRSTAISSARRPLAAYEQILSVRVAAVKRKTGVSPPR